MGIQSHLSSVAGIDSPRSHNESIDGWCFFCGWHPVAFIGLPLVWQLDSVKPLNRPGEPPAITRHENTPHLLRHRHPRFCGILVRCGCARPARPYRRHTCRSHENTQGPESSSTTGVDGNQNDNSAAYSGAAYVFVRSGNTWSQYAYLKASNTEAGDDFGASVAVSGSTVVVGASYEASNSTGVNGQQTDNSAFGSGVAYVFSGLS